MSIEEIKTEENKEFDCIMLNSSKKSEELIQNNISENKNFIPFTKKWRVKLYLLNESGQWDDSGIGYVFLANEMQNKGLGVCADCSYPSPMVKKLIMLKENTKELIFNINIVEENLEFHNQRGTILTWKKGGASDEDNIAISFQEKEGITEIFKNIRMINGETIQEDDVFFEEETPLDTLKDVNIENLPNILREIPPDMDETKCTDLVNYLEMTDCDLIKKLGYLLLNEEKKIEEIKSSISLNSQETDVSVNLTVDNKKEIINEITKKIINMGETERKF